MSTLKAYLFDMDGVVVNTEPQYDLFLKSFIEEYNLPSDFLSKIKGVRWPEIISMYFSDLSESEKKKLSDRVANFEINELKYIPIPGVSEYIHQLKKQGIKIALVTSSLKFKADIALHKMKLEKVFDVVITGDDIKNGKPDPECYLLAAEKLCIKPEECVVFEDSFAGIEAGKRAGMKVIALSTTNSEESLHLRVDRVIPDFINFTI